MTKEEKAEIKDLIDIINMNCYYMNSLGTLKPTCMKKYKATIDVVKSTLEEMLK